MTSLVNRFANFSVGKQYRNTVEREREFLPSHFTQQNLSYWFFAGFKSPSISPTENGKRWRHKKRDLNCGAFLFFLLERNEIAKVAHFEEGRAASVKSGHRERPEEDLDP